MKAKVKLKTIDNLKEFLIDYFKDKKVKVYLFGSRARGDNTGFSDIDIGIVSDEEISRDIVILREILEESSIPYKVDIVDLSKNRDLIDVVLKEGKRWF